MKKNKTILKTFFLFLFSLFLLQSCRNETVLDGTQENSAHKSKTLATLKEVLEATSLKTSKDVMARSTSISSLYNPNEYEMDTLTIRKTFHDNETTEYAIALKKKNETEKGVFYNLVFTKKDDKWKKFLIKLTPEYYKDTELITRHRIEIVSSESSKKGMKSASCSAEYFTLTVFDCPAGHTNPFDGDCSGCWKTVGSGFSYNCDQESINRDFNIGGDSVGGGGGGGVGVNPYELSAPLALNFYLQSKGGVLLSSEETAFLNSNVSLANSLKYYFLNNENENSPAFFHWTMSFFMQNSNTSWEQFQKWFVDGNQDFNKDLLKMIVDNNYKIPQYTTSDYPGKNNGMPFNWWNDENYLKNNISLGFNTIDLTLEEIKMCALFPAAALTISTNKNLALDTAANSFPGQNAHNNKADAFRHAFFNALNIRDVYSQPSTLGMFTFAKDIVRMFGIAHESEVPANLYLEKVMDLYNNEQGIEVCATCNPLTNPTNLVKGYVMSLLENGKLLHIWPLNIDQTIRPDSNLYPTNQY